MHRLLSILPICALAACAAINHAPPRDPSPELHLERSDAPPPPSSLRVVTYNVHGVDGATIAKAIQGDANLARADVILMQEVASFGPCSAACEAGNALGFASVYAPGHQQDGGTSGVAILSRWPLHDPQVIELPYKFAVMNAARRIALAATLDSAEGPVRLIAVHLENRINPTDRIEQLTPALEHARNFDGAVIIGGDMNTSPFVWLGHLVPVPAGVQDDLLESAVRAAGLETPVVDDRATSQWLGMRLDAIYTRGIKATAHGVEQTVRISDHLPLWMDATL
jgi:endonuclease/exonuclease/phosphatase family metal-dependent hydrolase